MSEETCRQCERPNEKGVHTCAYYVSPLSTEERELMEYLDGGQPAIFTADLEHDEVVIRPHASPDTQHRLSRVFARYLRHSLHRVIEQLEQGRPKRG